MSTTDVFIIARVLLSLHCTLSEIPLQAKKRVINEENVGLVHITSIILILALRQTGVYRNPSKWDTNLKSPCIQPFLCSQSLTVYLDNQIYVASEMQSGLKSIV